MKRLRVISGIAAALAAIPLCGCALLEGPHTVKFCGRDYGDRIQWSAAPRWFGPGDCVGENQAALWSDLYLACYSRKAGFIQGAGTLGKPHGDECKWAQFTPAEQLRIRSPLAAHPQPGR
jgi:hypothetical protein